MNEYTVLLCNMIDQNAVVPQKIFGVSALREHMHKYISVGKIANLKIAFRDGYKDLCAGI